MSKSLTRRIARGPPYAFTITLEERGDAACGVHSPSKGESEVWSVWLGPQRVGDLEGEVDIGTARVTLWGRRKSIETHYGASPAEKFKSWISSEAGERWIQEAEKSGE